jgi:hypothetical protein
MNCDLIFFHCSVYFSHIQHLWCRIYFTNPPATYFPWHICTLSSRLGDNMKLTNSPHKNSMVFKPQPSGQPWPENRPKYLTRRWQHTLQNFQMATLYSQDNISHTRWATRQKWVNVSCSNIGVIWHNSWLIALPKGVHMYLHPQTWLKIHSV